MFLTRSDLQPSSRSRSPAGGERDRARPPSLGEGDLRRGGGERDMALTSHLCAAGLLLQTLIVVTLPHHSDCCCRQRQARRPKLTQGRACEPEHKASSTIHSPCAAEACCRCCRCCCDESIGCTSCARRCRDVPGGLCTFAPKEMSLVGRSIGGWLEKKLEKLKACETNTIATSRGPCVWLRGSPRQTQPFLVSVAAHAISLGPTWKAGKFNLPNCAFFGKFLAHLAPRTSTSFKYLCRSCFGVQFRGPKNLKPL